MKRSVSHIKSENCRREIAFMRFLCTPRSVLLFTDRRAVNGNNPVSQNALYMLLFIDRCTEKRYIIIKILSLCTKLFKKMIRSGEKCIRKITNAGLLQIWKMQI